MADPTVTALTVSITSKLVSTTANEIRDMLLEHINSGITELTIDMAQVETVDSSGIGVLISAQNTIRPKNGIIKVINISTNILKMFKIMRLDKHFEVSGR